jgi:uncharacterized membrane protein (UPF0127 family)
VTIVENLTRGTMLADRAETARSPLAQLVGLMGKPALAAGGGLVFPRTRGVHTHFMRFPIDVVFYDKRGAVVDVVHALRPWRFSRYHWRAAGVVELPAGSARAARTEPGDILSIRAA